jgi:multidrug resistance efflux pump
MDDPRLLAPIPTPPAQRWREVRLLYLPRAVFALGVIVAAFMWTRWVTPATLIAEAEAVRVEVRSTQAGTLTGLKVAMLQAVRADEVVGHVSIANPKLLEATLAVIRAEVGMLAATMAGATDRQRVSLEFERLQIDWMNARVELAALRGRLQVAESDIARATPLHAKGLVTEDAFTDLKLNRDALVAQVSEQSQLVTRLEPVVRNFAASDPQGAGLSTDTALAASIKVQDAKLKLAEEQLMPVPLVAPIGGIVSLVLRRAGETVVAGEPILQITAAQPVRLTGFLRQPLPFEPKVGAVVEVRSRTNSRQSAQTKITHVGPAMETLPITLVSAMHLPPTPLPEPGLRIHIALPEGMTLRPGEFVDVIVQ